MAVSLDILDANASLASLEATLQQTEADLRFTLLSFAAGMVTGQRGNIVTFQHRGAAAAPAQVSLQVVDGGLSKDEQEAKLNTSGKVVVCYGSLYVAGQPQNVVALR